MQRPYCSILPPRWYNVEKLDTPSSDRAHTRSTSHSSTRRPCYGQHTWLASRSLWSKEDHWSHPPQIFLAWDKTRCCWSLSQVSNLPEDSPRNYKEVPLVPLPVISTPFSCIVMDMVGSLPQLVRVTGISSHIRLWIPVPRCHPLPNDH